jgi:hypothetical protein
MKSIDIHWKAQYRKLSSDKTSVTVTTTKPLHLPDPFFAFTSLYDRSMTIPLHAQ